MNDVFYFEGLVSSSVLDFTVEATMNSNLANWEGLAEDVFCAISVLDLLYFTTAD